jgi:U3 small nucleolar RNA-associated protein 11
MEKNKIERLKSTLHLLDTEDGSKNTHKFFVDSEKEKREFDLAERLGTHPDLVGRAYNRPR